MRMCSLTPLPDTSDTFALRIPLHPENAVHKENGNRMIRRFIPKGSDRSQIDDETIQGTEEWIHRYPRKILEFQTAEETYRDEVAA